MERSIWQEYRNQGVMVIGISNQPITTLSTFISDQGITFPVLQDRISTTNGTQSVYWKYLLSGGLSPYPRDFVIDQAGIIQFASTEYDPAAMITVIERLLEEAVIKTEPKQSPSPDRFMLHQNYPNPFNPVTTVEFDLPQAADVTLTVYDLMGRQVAVIVSGRLAPGMHTAVWNGRDTNNQELTSGIYIARLVTPENTQSIKMVLLK